MPKIEYETWRPHGKTIELISKANEIASSYAAQGYDLTLRQLYYQFVARDLIPNNQESYNKLGYVVSKARRAGLIDWNFIEDRTRNLAGNSHWDGPESIIDSAAASYLHDLWEGQGTRVEVWVEKEALAGVIARAAEAMDVSWFACRGYVSDSEMWRAGRRFWAHSQNGKDAVVLHLGDHDPSGIDMTRDIRERLELFSGIDVDVRRIALNMDQVEQYGPPPNPAKISDSRALAYIDQYGESSWELDALDPATLDALIREKITDCIDDPEAREEAHRQQERDRDLLNDVSARWVDVVDFIEAG